MKTPGELFDLTGKVAVVTGGSRGIGRAVAEGLAAAGADVVVASRKLENCQKAATEIAGATGRRTLPVACHVGQWEDCDRLVEAVYDEFGRCDVLVNNAGMSPLYDGLPSVTEALYDKVHAVNARGPFRLSALIGTRMAEGDGGSIINVTTAGSLRPNADDLPYAMAKAGLNALTLGLAGAWAPKVRANLVLPGAFDTDITKAWVSSWPATPPVTSTAPRCSSTGGSSGRSEVLGFRKVRNEGVVVSARLLPVSPGGTSGP
jgi:hypothetical protein